MNPGGSVKDRAAKNMMLEALASGELTKDKILLDSTSGNTGIAYAMIGAALGIRVQLVMPQNASEKSRLIEAFGAKVTFHGPHGRHRRRPTGVPSPLTGEPRPLLHARPVQQSQQLAGPLQNHGRRNLETNRGAVTHFVGGIGTSGTLMGTGRRLKELKPNIQIVAVEPATPCTVWKG
jgi:cysteine synthase B